jgi:hypothetical protein
MVIRTGSGMVVELGAVAEVGAEAEGDQTKMLVSFLRIQLKLLLIGKK